MRVIPQNFGITEETRNSEKLRVKENVGGK